MVSNTAVLLLSGHGIRQFRAGAESGHVTPARMRLAAGRLLPGLGPPKRIEA